MGLCTALYCPCLSLCEIFDIQNLIFGYSVPYDIYTTLRLGASAPRSRICESEGTVNLSERRKLEELFDLIQDPPARDAHGKDMHLEVDNIDG